MLSSNIGTSHVQMRELRHWGLKAWPSDSVCQKPVKGLKRPASPEISISMRLILSPLLGMGCFGVTLQPDPSPSNHRGIQFCINLWAQALQLRPVSLMQQTRTSEPPHRRQPILPSPLPQELQGSLDPVSYPNAANWAHLRLVLC